MGIYSATTEGEETTNVNPETLLAVLGSTTTKSKLIEWGVAFDGVLSTEAPVIVNLYQITSAGTSTGAVEVPWDRSAVVAQCTAFHSFTVEPTKGNRIACYELHPQGDRHVMQYPLGREPVISDGSAAQGIAIVVETALTTLNAVAYMVWEE